VKQPVIYKIRNVVNDKFYVGSTVDTRERFRTHRKMLRGNRHHCPHLQASWNKYGEDCFKFEVVEQVGSEELLWEVENRWLEEHFGKPYCYNAGMSAEAPMRGRSGELHPGYGRVVSEEQRQQISQTLKAFYAQDYFNHPRVGKQHTEETRVKIGEKVRQAGAFIPSEETRQKMSDALKGNQNAKGHKRSEAERDAIRQRTLGNQNWLGKTHTEESKDKLRRPVIAILPDGSRREFKGIALAGEELDTPYQMLVRICRDKKPVARGKFAGWQFFYADEEPAPVTIPEEFKHLPRTRQQAKEAGAKQYFTGLPCTHGHISPRATKGTCVACRKAGLG
jgi:group I intron endonuclease